MYWNGIETYVLEWNGDLCTGMEWRLTCMYWNRMETALKWNGRGGMSFYIVIFYCRYCSFGKCTMKEDAYGHTWVGSDGILLV